MSSARSPLRAAGVILFCVLLTSFYLAGVVRTYLSERAADAYNLSGLHHATRLAPGNAEFAHMLGLQLAESAAQQDRAIAELRRAAMLDPFIAQYWLDLASAYQFAGNVTEEKIALDAALKAEPNNPDITAEAAQYYLVAGDASRALPLLRHAMEIDPSAAAELIPACWRATRDVHLMLDQVVPPSPEAQLTFLRVLTQADEGAAANEVWRRILESKALPAITRTFFYFDFLLQKGDSHSLLRAWSEFISVDPSMRGYVSAGNRVVNSSFEEPVLNAGLDWRYSNAAGVRAGIDENVSHSGSRSLEITYTGEPAYEAGWQQFIPVEPGFEYDFGVWVKAENIESSSGPRLSLTDARNGATLLLTDDTLDSRPWRQLTGQVRVPPGTGLIVIKITRAPADSRIRGHFWIDDLHLARK